MSKSAYIMSRRIKFAAAVAENWVYIFGVLAIILSYFSYFPQYLILKFSHFEISEFINLINEKFFR